MLITSCFCHFNLSNKNYKILNLTFFWITSIFINVLFKAFFSYSMTIIVASSFIIKIELCFESNVFKLEILQLHVPLRVCKKEFSSEIYYHNLFDNVERYGSFNLYNGKGMNY